MCTIGRPLMGGAWEMCVMRYSYKRNLSLHTNASVIIPQVTRYIHC
jgi:hypothetical protein